MLENVFKVVIETEDDSQQFDSILRCLSQLRWNTRRPSETSHVA